MFFKRAKEWQKPRALERAKVQEQPSGLERKKKPRHQLSLSEGAQQERTFKANYGNERMSMDADLERNLIKALGVLSIARHTKDTFHGLTETQAAQAQVAMVAIGNILLEEEQLRKEQGRVHRLQVAGYRPRAWNAA